MPPTVIGSSFEINSCNLSDPDPPKIFFQIAPEFVSEYNEPTPASSVVCVFPGIVDPYKKSTAPSMLKPFSATNSRSLELIVDLSNA